MCYFTASRDTPFISLHYTHSHLEGPLWWPSQDSVNGVLLRRWKHCICLWTTLLVCELRLLNVWNSWCWALCLICRSEWPVSVSAPSWLAQLSPYRVMVSNRVINEQPLRLLSHWLAKRSSIFVPPTLPYIFLDIHCTLWGNTLTSAGMIQILDLLIIHTTSFPKKISYMVRSQETILEVFVMGP